LPVLRRKRTKFVSQGVSSSNAPKKGDDIELAASKAERLYLEKKLSTEYDI
jgi:hypothetical protein